MPIPNADSISEKIDGGVTIYQQVLDTTKDLASNFIDRIPYFVAALIVVGLF